jgi:hypothetical protein
MFKIFRLCGLAGVALLLGGCSTIPSRIEEKSALFAALDAETQNKIKQGRVEVGYSTDLVYIALGTPDERLTKTNQTGTTETWIYNSYRQEYLGTAHTGYRQYVVIDPKTRQAIVTYEPVYSSVYRDRVDERIRINFKARQVESIEQVKR